MYRKAFIIVGLGYGDEGKGLITDYLSLHSFKPLIIRFNGGQQAGHTVVTSQGDIHTFSNFGSGTFRNIPSYWSKYCTFCPTLCIDEFTRLSIKPILFVDKLCLVTTHYDVLYNRLLENTRGVNRYGSCGLGFGATIDRSRNKEFFFSAEDLISYQAVKEKLKIIRKYYKSKIDKETKFSFDQFDHKEEDIRFYNDVFNINKLIQKGRINLVTEKDIFSFSQWETFIFEGAQGILLDKKFGEKPFITKSNTTTKNALSILRRNFRSSHVDIEIEYVTRAYLTRHGGGNFIDEKLFMRLKNLEFESNVCNEFQGEFKKRYLNIDKLNYALKSDNNYSFNLPKNLTVTCLDQIATKKVFVYKSNQLIKIMPSNLPKLIKTKFQKCRFSFCSCAEYLE